MNITDFDAYKDLLREKSGLLITQDRCVLLETRLGPIAKKWGYPSLDAMTQAIKAMPEKNLVTDVIEAMVTIETSFFRDLRPFETFRDQILQTLVLEKKGTKKPLRIWCAGASSGQEPYSLSMLMLEKASVVGNVPIEIVATDISSENLSLAKKGVYSQLEVQRGLPAKFLIKYFDQDEDLWYLSDEVKARVTFKHFNLLDSMDKLGAFDAIFCRNVLSFFEEGVQKDVFKRLTKQLTPNGFLFLGKREPLPIEDSVFTPAPGKRDIYVRKDSAHNSAAA